MNDEKSAVVSHVMAWMKEVGVSQPVPASHYVDGMDEGGGGHSARAGLTLH